jgi:hypothetical protein
MPASTSASPWRLWPRSSTAYNRRSVLCNPRLSPRCPGRAPSTASDPPKKAAGSGYNAVHETRARTEAERVRFLSGAQGRTIRAWPTTADSSSSSSSGPPRRLLNRNRPTHGTVRILMRDGKWLVRPGGRPAPRKSGSAARPSSE